MVTPILRICTLALISVFAVSGCASKPIIDTAGVDMQQYQADLADCEQVANQVPTDEMVVASAGFGAFIGALFGLVTGDASAVAYGAGWGAVSGASSGGLNADQEKSTVTKNCLYNRGYAVLN